MGLQIEGNKLLEIPLQTGILLQQASETAQIEVLKVEKSALLKCKCVHRKGSLEGKYFLHFLPEVVGLQFLLIIPRLQRLQVLLKHEPLGIAQGTLFLDEFEGDVLLAVSYQVLPFKEKCDQFLDRERQSLPLYLRDLLLVENSERNFQYQILKVAQARLVADVVVLVQTQQIRVTSKITLEVKLFFLSLPNRL